MPHEIKNAIRAEISIKAKWLDLWVLIPGATATNLTFALSPDIGRAEISFPYGDVKEFGSTKFAPRPPLNPIDFYIKIDLYNQGPGEPEGPGPFGEPLPFLFKSWYGVVVEEIVDRADAAHGHQAFMCYDLAYLLEREIITTSVAKDATRDWRLKVIERAISFNYTGTGSTQSKPFIIGNMAADATDPVPVFCRRFGLQDFAAGPSFPDLKSSKNWNAGDIVKYLVAFQPREDLRDPGFDWRLDATNGFPDDLGWFPVVSAEGRTVKSILDQLLSRNRLIGWRATVSADGLKPVIQWFPLTDTDIFMPEEVQFGAPNPDVLIFLHGQRNVVNFFGTEPGWGRIDTTITHSSLHKFDRVLVRGARIGTTFTIHKLWQRNEGERNLKTAEETWTEGQQELYELGASKHKDYEDSFYPEKQAMNKRVRSSKLLQKVFSWYRIVDEWQGVNQEFLTIMPDFFQDLSVGGLRQRERGGAFWRPGLRVSRTLPLLQSIDYSGDKLKGLKDRPLQEYPGGGRPPAMLPLLYVLDNYIDDELWLDLGNPARGSQHSLLASYGSNISARIVPLEGDCGFAILVRDSRPGGGGSHALALGRYTNRVDIDDPIDPVDKAPDFSLDDVRITIHIELDHSCQAWFDAVGNQTRERGQREMVIEMGDSYRLEWVAPDTVIGIDEDGQLITTDGGYLYDDRTLLRQIAILAFGWYSRPRMAIDAIFQYGDLAGTRYGVGTFIKRYFDNSLEVAVEPTIPPSPAGVQPFINSVVTKEEYDLNQGTLRIVTDFAQLDVKEFV